MDERAIIDAYERHEQAAGGLSYADPRECVERAAAECGVTYEQARSVLIEEWAGSLRAG